MTSNEVKRLRGVIGTAWHYLASGQASMAQGFLESELLPLGYCKECGAAVSRSDRIERSDCYECPECSQPTRQR